MHVGPFVVPVYNWAARRVTLLPAPTTTTPMLRALVASCLAFALATDAQRLPYGGRGEFFNTTEINVVLAAAKHNIRAVAAQPFVAAGVSMQVRISGGLFWRPVKSLV